MTDLEHLNNMIDSQLMLGIYTDKIIVPWVVYNRLIKELGSKVEYVLVEDFIDGDTPTYHEALHIATRVNKIIVTTKL